MPKMRRHRERLLVARLACEVTPFIFRDAKAAVPNEIHDR